MRTAVLVVFVLGVALAQLAYASSGLTQPRLAVVDKAPLVLRGTGFVPGERISVTVATRDEDRVRRTRASRLGRFLVRFDVAVDACYGAQRAAAVGRRGSKASIVLERPWQRECVEPGSTP